MRWVFRIIGVLLLAVVALFGLLMLLPADKIARIAADQIESRTGRSLTLEGDVSVTLWPVLGVRTGPVVLANADWAGPDPMLSAQSLAIGVETAALWGGDIRLREITLDAPVLRLSQHADGRVNWDLAPDTGSAAQAQTGAGGATAPIPLTLDRLRVTDGRLILTTPAHPVLDLSDIALDLSLPDVAAGLTFDLAVTRSGVPLSMTGTLGDMAAFLSGAVVPLRSEARLASGTVRFDGRVSRAAEAAGRLVVTIPDAPAWARFAGVSLDPLPDGLGRNAIVAAGDVTYTTDGRLSLRDLTLDLDGNRLSGGADVILSDKPNVIARLTAGALDFSALGGASPAGSGASGPQGGAQGWSRAPIDASALGLMDATLRLSAQSILTSQTALGLTELTLKIDRARAVLDLEQLTAFDGVIRGQLVANNRNGLSVGGKLKVHDISLKKALSDLAGVDRLTSVASADLEFLGAGESVDAIMKSLNGKGALSLGNGAISGIDLDALFRSGGQGSGTTVFDSLVASYVIQAGTLLNEDLLVLMPAFRATGTGRIGLGARDVDYLFTPAAMRQIDGQELSLPLRVSGPWADLSIRPDLDAALKAKAEVRLETLEDNAREQVRTRLQEELGVTIPEGKNPEEAIKDAIEDRARDQLLKLLGRN